MQNFHHLRRSNDKISDWIMFSVAYRQIRTVVFLFHNHFMKYQVKPYQSKFLLLADGIQHNASSTHPLLIFSCNSCNTNLLIDFIQTHLKNIKCLPTRFLKASSSFALVTTCSGSLIEKGILLTIFIYFIDIRKTAGISSPSASYISTTFCLNSLSTPDHPFLSCCIDMKHMQ